MAIAVWPTPSVSKTTTQELPSGNHIVGYDLKNCDYFDKTAGAVPTNIDEKVYYEVRQGSTLTDEQLQQALQGMCEEKLDGSAISTAMKKLQDSTTTGDFSTEALTVNAITKDSITVSLDSHYAPGRSQVQPNLTYTQFSKNLLVYNRSDKADYGDIHAGDTVIMALHQNSKPQPVAPNYYVAENDTANITILAIVRVPPLTTDPSLMYDLWGTEIVRLDPCTTSPTGFCRAYDFANNSSVGDIQGSNWHIERPDAQ